MSCLTRIAQAGWIVLFGVLSIVFGLSLQAAPLLSVYVLVLYAAGMATAGGIGGIVTAFRLRRVVA